MYVIHSAPQYYITVHIKIYKKSTLFRCRWIGAILNIMLDNMERASICHTERKKRPEQAIEK
jgi:hypothetical protein